MLSKLERGGYLTGTTQREGLTSRRYCMDSGHEGLAIARDLLKDPGAETR